jgi:hypothetical protein
MNKHSMTNQEAKFKLVEYFADYGVRMEAGADLLQAAEMAIAALGRASEAELVAEVIDSMREAPID